MNQDTLDKIILLVWVCFSIRFLFFSYWDIVFLPPILILLDGLHNIEDHEQVSGDSNPEAGGRYTQGSKFKEQKKHFTSLDILVQLMIQEELERIGKKPAASLK
ncbi:hypothetical protein TNIN_26831 [Trichonephila inaurata madagascariensis]|uniref:Uncharacterized protein n=1 Tax=Trichonephila inaurata madagascariensis TaxID=2747483 RepID=A0A8X7CQ16_9ARAC|nr:hypothetical protein TNIN_26831 [Trichonephila inaurata madagascariensis]